MILDKLKIAGQHTPFLDGQDSRFLHSEWQKGISNILIDIDKSVKEVINRIDYLEASLSSEIRTLESSISDKMIDMQSSVVNSLGSLNNQIGYSNLVSTINLIKK
jgi:hypothetical protein